MDAYTCMSRWVRGSMYLLSDDSLIQRDQRSDPGSHQDALVASIERRVNTSHVLEVDKPAKSDILSEDDKCQQGLDDVEGQRVKLIGKMR